MTTLPIIVYGNGDLFKEYFNAIVATFGSNNFTTLIRIAILLSGATVAFALTMQRDLMVVVKWFGIFYLSVFMLFTPKATVVITDRVNGDARYAVDHVPLGLAIVASYTSVIGDSLTQTIESNFTMPDYMPYHKTGMVFASRLVDAASQFEITDATFDANLSEFIHQCVFYDVLLNKYSLNDLKGSTNVWSLVTRNASPARAFIYNGDIVTCRDGVAHLTEDWKAAKESALTQYGKRIYPHLDNTAAKIKIGQDLGQSYRYLTKLSASADEIMQQNLIANAIQRGVLSFSSKLDAAAAMESYAFTRAQEQKRLTNKTLGDMAAYWLPLMKNAFEAIMYGAFIFIVLLSVFPFGGMIIKNYVYTLLWIQIWAPLYAIINLMVSYYAQLNTAAAVSNGLTMASLSGVLQINSDISGLAGYLTLSVPFLSAGLVKGMAGTFTQLSQYVGSVTQSSGGTAAAEAVTGNMSFGNTSLGNHNAYNTSANHFDTSGKFSSGFLTTPLSGGSQLTMTPDGSNVMNMQNAISNLGTSIDFADALRSSYANQAEKSYSARLSDAKGLSDTTVSSTRDINELSKHWNKSSASGEGWNFSTNAATGYALGNIQSSIQDYASRHQISYDKAANVLASAYVDGKVSVGGNGVVIGGSVDGGLSRSATHNNSTNKGSQFSDAESYIRNSNYSENVDTVSRAVQDKSLRVNNEEGTRLVNNTNASLDKAESFRRDMQSNYEKAERASECANLAEEHAQNIRVNASQEYAQWLFNQPGTDGRGRLGVHGVEALKDDHVMSQHYVGQYVEKMKRDFESTWAHGLASSEGEIKHHFQDNNQQIKNPSSVGANYQHNANDMLTKSHNQGIDPNALIDSMAKHQTENLIQTSKNKVLAGENNVMQKGENQHTKVKDEESRHRNASLFRDMAHGINTKDRP